MDDKRPIVLSYTPPIGGPVDRQSRAHPMPTTPMHDSQPAAHGYAPPAPGPSDPPPAYSLERSPSRSSSDSSKSSATGYTHQQLEPLPPPPIPQTFASIPAANRLYISTKSDSISGTYILDPSVPQSAAVEKPRLPREAKRALKKNARASVALASRRGHINVRLLVRNPTVFTGAEAHPEPAFVCATARRGSIYLDIAEKPPNRPLSLYTSSRRGSTTVHLPPNFNGTVELTSDHGRTETLPGLAAYARVVHSKRSNKLQLAIGDATGKDFVRLDSHDGDIRVGMSGVDDGAAQDHASASGSGKQFRPVGGPGMPGDQSVGAKQFRI